MLPKEAVLKSKYHSCGFASGRIFAKKIIDRNRAWKSKKGQLTIKDIKLSQSRILLSVGNQKGFTVPSSIARTQNAFTSFSISIAATSAVTICSTSGDGTSSSVAKATPTVKALCGGISS